MAVASHPLAPVGGFSGPSPDRYSSNSAETAASIGRRGMVPTGSVRRSETRRRRDRRNHRIVAHVRCVPLAEAVVSELDAAKDAPRVSTQPYTTFDHRSTAGRRGELPLQGRPGCSVLHSVQPPEGYPRTVESRGTRI